MVPHPPPDRYRTAGYPSRECFAMSTSRHSSVRYVVRWNRLTEMLALSASAVAVIGYVLWG
jgi:hypothetical protein